MEFAKLTEVELRYFNDLFSVCDVENSGKVSGVKAAEVFRASHLPPDQLQLITDICGAKRLGHFGRSQFYIAMKLIAAAQLGLPIKLETINTGLELPLPKFSRITEDKTVLQKQYSQSQQIEIEPALSDRLEGVNHSRTQSKNNVNSSLIKPLNISVDGDKITSPSSDPSQSMSFSSESFGVPPGEASSPRSMVEKEWSVYLNNKQSYLSDYDQWQQFEDERQLLTTEDDNSERHSSDDEYDVWSISSEQREYYINQFRLLQPDLGGLLSGAVAKDFFEKSKLPMIELSKIWQLSDVNKDGALCLEEFFTAMHLVVLRRNNVELPDNLPPVLIPQINNMKLSKDNNNRSVTSPESSPPLAMFPVGKEWTQFNDSPTSIVSSPGVKPVNFDFQQSAVEQDPKILHPVALRLSPEGQVVSESDIDNGELTHPSLDAGHYELLNEQERPVSKKSSLGPNSAPLIDELSETVAAPPSQVVIQRPVAKKASSLGAGALPPPPTASFAASLTSQDDSSEGSVLHLARDHRSGSFSGSSSASMPMAYPAAINQSAGPKKDPPPPPPPRPKRNHARSSSLDLNRLGKSGFAAPPAVPPRVSPSMRLVSQKSESDAGLLSAMPDNSNMSNVSQLVSNDDVEIVDDVPQLKTGAFEVYKRLSDDAVAVNLPATIPESSTQQIKSAIMKEDGISHVNAVADKDEPKEKRPQVMETDLSRDRKELLSIISRQSERNTVLNRLNMELNQELAEVMEERIVLEIQLEHLKPFSN